MPIGNDVFIPLEVVIARHLGELFPGWRSSSHDHFRVTRDADFTVPTRQTISSGRWRTSCAVAASARPSASRSRPRWRPTCASTCGAARSRGDRGRRRGRAARPRGPLVAARRRGRQALRYPPWQPAVKPEFTGRRRARRRVRGHARVICSCTTVRPSKQRRTPGAAGGGGPGRPRGQDDGVPDLGRLRTRAVTDRSGRARQAGGLPGGAEGPLRRAAQHRLGARARGGRRARGARSPRPQDPRQGPARGAARGPRRPPLRSHRNGTTTRRPHASTRTTALHRDREIAADVAELFNALTGAARSPGYRKTVVAPDHMRTWLLDQVEQTIDAHRTRRRASS